MVSKVAVAIDIESLFLMQKFGVLKPGAKLHHGGVKKPLAKPRITTHTTNW